MMTALMLSGLFKEGSAWERLFFKIFFWGGRDFKEGKENIVFFDYLLIQEQKSRTEDRLHSGRDSQSRGKFSSYWLVGGCCYSFCFCLSAPFSIPVIFKPWSALFAMMVPNNQIKTFFYSFAFV